MFVTNSYRTLKTSEEKKGGNADETIELPPYLRRRREANYAYLDANGIVRKRINGRNTYVKIGDVIVGKTIVKHTKEGEKETIDASLTITGPEEEGYIDAIHDIIGSNGCRMVKIVTRKHRIPEVGDKFASDTAQKCTVGLTVRQEDMPFNSEGICPDMLFNPAGVPSQHTA